MWSFKSDFSLLLVEYSKVFKSLKFFFLSQDKVIFEYKNDALKSKVEGPDQTAPGAVWSGPELFAQAFMLQN